MKDGAKPRRRVHSGAAAEIESIALLTAIGGAAENGGGN
jgi:hypothetical protein